MAIPDQNADGSAFNACRPNATPYECRSSRRESFVKCAGLIFLVVLLCDCSTSQKRLRPDAKTASLSNDFEFDDIREAVFRYQFEHNASSLQTRAAAYYLELRTTEGAKSDPPDSFLKRFTGNSPAVHKRSAARVAMEEIAKQADDPFSSLFLFPQRSFQDTGVTDRLSGRPGLIFYQQSINRISNSKAEVHGGYYEGGESSSGNTYTVEKQNGKWTVTKNIMRWISKIPPHFEQLRIVAEVNIAT
jgi:hypothetical protein